MNSVERVFIQIREAVDGYLKRHAAQPVPGAGESPQGPPQTFAERRESLAHLAWLNVAQAVRYLGLPSRKALYQAIRRGHVPVHRMGRTLRFLRTELDEDLSRR